MGAALEYKIQNSFYIVALLAQWVFVDKCRYLRRRNGRHFFFFISNLRQAVQLFPII